MRSFAGRDILSLKEFERNEFFHIFEVAQELEPIAQRRRNSDLLAEKNLLTAFYQPSTRTRLATEAAMHRLGGHVLGFSDAKMTRAGDFYQESIKDTVHMLEFYGDVIVMRHFQEGAPREAAKWASVPIINAGDGWGEHPTQVLTDLYTIYKEKGTLDNLNILCIGDMRMRTMQQLNWEVPDWIICNTGSGGLLSGIATGFTDWLDLDWIDKLPKMVAVQPDACAPIVKAFKENIKPFDFEKWPGFPDTVAGGLADPYPWDADTALEMLYLTNGDVVSVPDVEIINAQKRLASKEGIFGEPSGVASIAALDRLVEDGTIDKSEVVVVPITGHGLKDPSVLKDVIQEAIICPPDVMKLAEMFKD